VITFNSIRASNTVTRVTLCWWVVVVGILTRTLMGESWLDVPEMIVWLVRDARC
jgi:hypothetical protein